jgi:ABC-type multidrug transport system fused ATPase/permease subunit
LPLRNDSLKPAFSEEKSASDEEIAEAASIAQADDFINEKTEKIRKCNFNREAQTFQEVRSSVCQ